MAGHMAACNMALAHVEEEYANAEKSALQLRCKAMHRLKSAGIPQFFVEDDGSLEPALFGTIKTEDGSVTHWAVYNKADIVAFFDFQGDSEQSLMVQLWAKAFPTLEDRQKKIHDLGLELTGWAGYYGGPGRPFMEEPVSKESKNRILVTWTGGLDI